MRKRVAATRLAPSAAVATLLLLTAASAQAHTTSKSYSTWMLEDDGAHVELRITLLELSRFPPGMALGEYLAGKLRLATEAGPCVPSRPVRIAHEPPGWAVYRWSLDCQGLPPGSIESDLLAGVVPNHLHFVRVAQRDEVRERVLAPSDPVWLLQEHRTRGTSLGGYLRLGIEHIAAGWDHLAFVFALILLSASLGEVARLVTGFTVAHSLTLGLAVLGVLRPESTSVEILIGFSIALVAAENGWLLGGRRAAVPLVIVAALLVAAGLAWGGSGALAPAAWLGLALFSSCHFGLLKITRRPERFRAMVAFAFGLVHGFAFAGVLMEIDLPVDRLLPALFGFNVGVEIGQLLVVALVFPLLRLVAVRAEGRWHRLVAEAGSAGVLLLGLFWVVTRAW